MDGDSTNQPAQPEQQQSNPAGNPANSQHLHFDPQDHHAAPGQHTEVNTQMIHEFSPPPVPQPSPKNESSFKWAASEFIAHQKSIGWYSVLILVTIVVAGGVFFLTHDKISTFVILIVALVFGVAASRKPRIIEYVVDNSGLSIGQHFYEYAVFRSFAILQDGPFTSIVFMPIKRFMPLITVYYDPKDEQKIMSILSNRMPLDTHRLDFMDQFMRRIRF
ncbi:MAG TPA: hypothetical protein VLG47_02905 [Candidatus Saccharimonadales bacterium]|nr:hypothetical protein [Candidatus Saccharimonadales bacterium]